MTKKSTTKYDMFVLTDDNRAKGVDKAHLKRIVTSIQATNMLEYRPIIVDADMNVLDGQHRLKAAEQLGLPIWYEIKADVDLHDVVKLNISKPWGMLDYFNFFVKNNYPEYIKLDKFLKANAIEPRMGLHLFKRNSKNAQAEFREGEYVFNGEDLGDAVNVVFQCRDLLGQHVGTPAVWNTKKVLSSLMKMVTAPGFNIEHWAKNIRRYADKICIRANNSSQLMHFLDIYNKGTDVKLNYEEI